MYERQDTAFVCDASQLQCVKKNDGGDELWPEFDAVPLCMYGWAMHQTFKIVQTVIIVHKQWVVCERQQLTFLQIVSQSA